MRSRTFGGIRGAGSALHGLASDHLAKRRCRFFTAHIGLGTGSFPIVHKPELFGDCREARIVQGAAQASIPEQRRPRILLRRRDPARDLERLMVRTEIAQQPRDRVPLLVFIQPA